MKNEDPTGFTKGEIAAAIVGVLIPIVLFTIALTPGAIEALALAVLKPGVLSALSVIGAILVAALLIFRIWSRTRRKKKGAARDPNRPPSFWDFWRNPYR